MGLRPARTHRKPRRAWTRTAKRVAKKAYIRGVPDSKLRSFNMGDAKIENCDLEVDLITSMSCQIRDNALEAARIAANKIFETKITKENYYFKIRIYPHQCLRERTALSGAGADRLANHHLWFGRVKGRAAAVKKDQVLFSVYTTKKFEQAAKQGIMRAVRKLPGVCKAKSISLKEN